MNHWLWRACLIAAIAWAFFNILLNYGYILSFTQQLLVSQNPYVFGAVVVSWSFVATATGFLVGGIVCAAFFPKREERRAPVASALISAGVFTALQILAFIPQLTASGTPVTETYTVLELAVSIVSAFIAVRLFQFDAGARAQLNVPAINALGLAIAIPLTYVTFSLSAESYSLTPSAFAYALHYSAYGILPLVIAVMLISHIRTSVRWAAAGLLVSCLPLAVFYLVGTIT